MSKLRKVVSPRADNDNGDVPANGLKPLRKRRAQAVELNGAPANTNGHSAQEPQAIRDARVRLRSLIQVATADATKPSVGIVLAIVNQETGHHRAANALIEEYGLDTLFGIKKFT